MSYSENYKAIQWGDHSGWQRQKPTKEAPSGAFYVMPDITPFQSPIDYSEITSRSALREHEKRHNVVQCGELKTPQDFSNAPKETFNEKRFDAAFREALQRHGV